MSLGRQAVAAGLLIWLAAAPAHAQDSTLGASRFFADAAEDEEDRQSTTFDGSLTSTTFYYREQGDKVASPVPGGPLVYSASPVDRIFTDLRGQLDAKHIAGSKFDFRADMRGRVVTTTFSTNSDQPVNPEGTPTMTDVPYQSGSLYGNEFELRELYVRRDGSSLDVSVGRQYSLELAATKFDGIKVEPEANQHWKFILFGGLYPSRNSRDLREDYPQYDKDPMLADFQPARVMPVTGGAGTAYRYQSIYGSLGAVGILPLADDFATGEAEEARVFATANGYWRQSANVDVYHYIVADAAGAGGAGLTNLTLGVNLQPTPRLRAYASVSRIDTETLNSIAQTKLEDPDIDPGMAVQVQNNVEVQRIAQESARVGLSANFSNRFEISTSGALRRRGELRFDSVSGDPNSSGDDIVFPAAQAADLTLSAVDRRSLGGMRLGASVTSSFGVGNANLYRSQALIGRLDANKQFADGRAELEGNLTYVGSGDDNRGSACDLREIPTCYGAAELQSITAGLLAYYRFRPEWFAMFSGSLGAQQSKAANTTGGLVDQPTILSTALLFRLAYRF